MGIIEEYGGTVIAVAVGSMIGVGILGILLNVGKEYDFKSAEYIRDGLGG